MAAGGNKTKADAAGKVVEDYVNAAPDGFHLPEAKLILGKVKILTGDAAGAEDLMAVVEADAGRGGWPGHWVAQAQFVKAQAQSAQGKHDDARNSYKMVVTTVGAALGQGPLHNKDLLLLQTEAKVMQGETFIQQKYYDDALAYFRALASSGGAGLKAAARTGEGQILYLQGRDKADVRVLRLAQLALAEAAIEADTNPSTSAKALFYMGKVLQALGDKEANGLARGQRPRPRQVLLPECQDQLSQDPLGDPGQAGARGLTMPSRNEILADWRLPGLPRLPALPHTLACPRGSLVRENPDAVTAGLTLSP
jgi:tetratricopeptide (TPR) repeat protein